MLSFRDLVSAFRRLEIDSGNPVIAHASLSAFGQVNGGAETLLGALLTVFPSIMMPTFTYKTMLIPEDGPQDNGMIYGSGHDQNALAEFFRPDLPSDRLMGIIPESLRHHPRSHRSSHPILSFSGVNVDSALESQNLSEPLAPIRILAESHGWILLLGVDHTVNTSIHYGEAIAGRKQFIRWALTTSGIQECPGFPGCSEGFQAIAPHVESITRHVQAGQATVQALPIDKLVETVVSLINADPLTLLCDRSYCERCSAVRNQSEIAQEPDTL